MDCDHTHHSTLVAPVDIECCSTGRSSAAMIAAAQAMANPVQAHKSQQETTQNGSSNKRDESSNDTPDYAPAYDSVPQEGARIKQRRLIEERVFVDQTGYTPKPALKKKTFMAAPRNLPPHISFGDGGEKETELLNKVKALTFNFNIEAINAQYEGCGDYRIPFIQELTRWYNDKDVQCRFCPPSTYVSQTQFVDHLIRKHGYDAIKGVYCVPLYVTGDMQDAETGAIEEYEAFACPRDKCQHKVFREMDDPHPFDLYAFFEHYSSNHGVKYKAQRRNRKQPLRFGYCSMDTIQEEYPDEEGELVSPPYKFNLESSFKTISPVEECFGIFEMDEFPI